MIFISIVSIHLYKYTFAWLHLSAIYKNPFLTSFQWANAYKYCGKVIVVNQLFLTLNLVTAQGHLCKIKDMKRDNRKIYFWILENYQVIEIHLIVPLNHNILLNPSDCKFFICFFIKSSIKEFHKDSST